MTVAIADTPLFTALYSAASDYRPDAGTFLYGTSLEDRSKHMDHWKQAVANVTLGKIDNITPGSARIENENSHVSFDLQLRGNTTYGPLWAAFPNDPVVLDITGLPHHVWAPILRSALESKRHVKALYVEPGSYTFSRYPTEGQIFDLSSRIEGIQPLPGFASLPRRRQGKELFVPLLGFEGSRYSHMVEQLQPGPKIFPIVGVPGFRPEYPFYTYAGNKKPLLDGSSWHNVRLVPANCPFSAYSELRRILTEHRDSLLRVAPIGTKPHSLGAILFKIQNPQSVEIIYDHPVRKPGRTSAADRLLVYDISAWL